MGNPQPSPKALCAMDAVQRLNVGGLWYKLEHKIKSTPMETWLGGGINSCCIQLLRRVSRDLARKVGTRARVLQLNTFATTFWLCVF
jgi:hypothetical protein